MSSIVAAEKAKEVQVQHHEQLKPLDAATLNLVIGGTYEHYSGKRYQIIDLARHTESNEGLVIYKALYDGNIWARPISMFIETVILNGVVQPRFRLVAQ
ncbi:DUF1653 domain-containing protein [Candidatus Dependentiae bacterium]|nr:DUF1653 domain-containing protein [Candidatus Dependentiae bacterium]